MGRASIGRRLAAAALCACLAAMGVPAAALAQDDPAPGEGAPAAGAGKAAPIALASFEDPDPASYDVAAGEDLPDLPGSLLARDGSGAQIFVEGVSWECADDDPVAPGTHVFAAVLPEGFEPDPAAQLPQVTVTVAAPQAPEPAFGAIAPRGAANGVPENDLGLVLDVVFDDGIDMQSAIDTALGKLPAGKDKADVTDIVVTGDATAIAGNDWTALKNCYKDGSAWTSLSGLDLLKMDELGTVSGADGGGTTFGRLARVWLPDTMGSIGDYAFSGCTSLRLEYLPEGVTSVGAGAFQGCTSLALGSLVEGVRYVGESAFEGCTSLVLGRLPDSIEFIKKSAFSGCEKLDFSEIPANVLAIEPMAFSGCKNLERVSFPVGLKFVGESAFEGCANLKELSFRSENPPKLDADAFKGVARLGTVYCADATAYETEFGAKGPSGWRYEPFYALEVIFDGGDGSGTAMQAALDAALADVGKGKIGAKDIVVTGAATEVTKNDWGKLKRCYQRNSEWANLSGLDLSDMSELTAVGVDDRLIKDSFYDRLVDLKLPSGLKTIDEYAFLNCYNLVLDELPSSLEAVGQNAFDYCYSLALDELPSGLTSIGANAFKDCSSLALEELPVGVEDVPDCAFQGCTSLALEKLPANLSSIGRDAFNGCEKLAISALPVKVPSIGSYAFSKCKGLKTMVLPPALQSVGGSAFKGCTSLAELEFRGPAPSLGEGAFEGVPSHGALYALEGAGYVKGDFGGDDLAGWDFFTMARRTLVDEATGVKVTGVFSPSAALLVEEGGLHLEDACAACDAMREREAAGEVLGEYSVSLALGRLWGGVEVSFPVVGAAYDGRTVAVLHCAGGELEAVDATVSAGYATGAFSSLSPFAVVALKDVPTPLPTPKSDDVVKIGDMAKTGDGPAAAPWLALASIAFLVAALAVVRRRSVRR